MNGMDESKRDTWVRESYYVYVTMSYERESLRHFDDLNTKQGVFKKKMSSIK